MTLTIFTPTHRPAFMARAAASILSQADGLNVEWLVVLNSGAKWECDDRRVRVIRAPEWMDGSVGALKRFACESATGDVLIELDHDDELLPGCLQAVAQGLSGETNGFFHSANESRNADGSCGQIYGEQWGWQRGIHNGTPYNVPFGASPRSLCEIFWAPNHVRAWTRKAYELSGGHDPRLEICDDHDLLCRTYLAGAQFILNTTPLYRQHVGVGNTQTSRNAEIQVKTAVLKGKYLHRLIFEWCRRNDLLMLDLGGAHGCPAGFIPVDKVKVPGGIQADIAKDGIPIVDRPIGCIRASDFLEHVPRENVIGLMNSIYKSLVPAGWLICKTPSSTGKGAFGDPTHVSFWNDLSFRYFCEDGLAKYVPELQCSFQAVRNFTTAGDNYVYSDLCALKGQRQPGRCLIAPRVREIKKTTAARPASSVLVAPPIMHIVTSSTRRVDFLARCERSIGQHAKGAQWFICTTTDRVTEITELFPKASVLDVGKTMRMQDGINHYYDKISDFGQWVYTLDDDNLIHPNFKTVIDATADVGCDMICFGQQLDANHVRHPEIAIQRIDAGQFVVRRGAVGDLRYWPIYRGDGYFACEIKIRAMEKRRSPMILQEVASFYNAQTSEL